MEFVYKLPLISKGLWIIHGLTVPDLYRLYRLFRRGRDVSVARYEYENKSNMSEN